MFRQIILHFSSCYIYMYFYLYILLFPSIFDSPYAPTHFFASLVYPFCSFKTFICFIFSSSYHRSLHFFPLSLISTCYFCFFKFVYPFVLFKHIFLNISFFRFLPAASPRLPSPQGLVGNRFYSSQ